MSTSSMTATGSLIFERVSMERFQEIIESIVKWELPLSLFFQGYANRVSDGEICFLQHGWHRITMWKLSDDKKTLRVEVDGEETDIVPEHNVIEQLRVVFKGGL